MSDVLIQSLITACLTLGLAIVGAWKLNAMAKTGDATHALVNSNFAIQLKLTATVTQRLANLTKDATDIEAANLAQKAYDAHMAKQAVVDAKV